MSLPKSEANLSPYEAHMNKMSLRRAGNSNVVDVIEWLGARTDGRRVIYLDGSTNRYYGCFVDDLDALRKALLSDPMVGYSLWCSETHSQECSADEWEEIWAPSM